MKNKNRAGNTVHAYRLKQEQEDRRLDRELARQKAEQTRSSETSLKTGIQPTKLNLGRY